MKLGKLLAPSHDRANVEVCGDDDRQARGESNDPGHLVLEACGEIPSEIAEDAAHLCGNRATIADCRLG